MSLDTHVQVNLTINNSGVALAGFGLIAALTYSTVFPERFRTYSKASDAVTDGFAADSPEVLFINKVMGQARHPQRVALIRGELPPTMRYLLEAAAIRNSSDDYAIQVDGEGVTSTEIEVESDASATKAEVHSATVTALNAVTGKNFTASFAAATAAAGAFTATHGTETFTKAAHGFQTGDGPYQLTTTTTLPAGLALATDYWIIRVDANDFQLATSLANALAGTAQPISDDGTGVHTITPNTALSPTLPFTVTADAPGEWFSLEVLDTTAWNIEQNHVDPGVATDLAAIRIANKTWYYLHTFYNSDDYVKAAAAWAEANGVMYYFDSQNTDAENTAQGNGEALDDIWQLNYRRVVPSYYPSPKHMHSAGWMAILASYNPGKWSAAYKTVVGSVAKQFSDTQITNLDARKASYYKEEAGRAITWEGRVGNTDYAFADITTGLDWFLDALKKRCFGVYIALPKVALTDEDVAKIKAAAEGVVDLGKSDAYDIIAPGTPGSTEDPVPTVTFPKVADLSTEDRTARRITGALITFRMQGASHSVIFDVTASF